METLSAMQGFIVIGIIIGIGYLAARANVGGPTAQMVLQRFAFFVATPCLMFTLISKENLADVFTSSMAVAFGSAVITGTAFMLLARFVFRLDLADSTVGTLVSMYMNANNIGLPVATYILGDPAAVTESGVLDRVVAALGEETRLLLADGVVASEDDVNLAMILGAGFPRHRGGLTPYLRSAGELR